ncbi:hypothetical protein PFICI_14491 [Pestalotiopsis fici W106-1]|uniref:2EXR domain-containing protein n=1 Tax=Pestalotiopsis fici (strain W106-1 / CGMCC3.15140) TaxID=1229662 RepID=W3WHY2_PESFW|nr:uncharacterized protein PFICI_14491 [Pestalotiopsis fici W106-1]ETS73545.1 hypothetical protein PFICI_14491 [Pestalotiopsis fici W106-1]
MSTLHSFSRLPFELRAHIWALTVEPRTVEVRIVYGPGKLQRLVSSTLVPAILQTCHEARSLGLYKQAFSELTITESSDTMDDISRYVWLNLDIDMISIGTTSFESFVPVSAFIKRLRFERKNSEEYFYHWESKELRDWTSTEEIHVVCEDGLGAWHGATEEHSWPCALENLWFFDPYDGRMMRSLDMEEMLDNELRESWAAEGYEYPSGDSLL